MSAAPITKPEAPVAFMSYARFDDGDGGLSRFQARLEDELRAQTGTEIEIFRDGDDISLGEQWRSRLDEGLAASTFLLPIITPSFFTSAYCREELDGFHEHNAASGRSDLVLPVYYIDCEDFLASQSDEAVTKTAQRVFEHQYFDWRDLCGLAPGNPRVRRERQALAKQILAATLRVAPAGPPPVTESSVSIVRERLPECCVRIDVGGTHAGSGFFVAPGIVVTCNHVLSLGRLSSEEAGASISVVSPTGGTYEVLDTRESSPAEQDDLAVLRVRPAHGHAVVLLDTGLRDRDPLYTHGFSEEHPDGATKELTAQRWEEMNRWLRVADGEVRRGMSGAPVFNQRTGAVCGVLRRNRYSRQALEGSVVSVRRLLSLSPVLSSANFRYHTTHREIWFDQLPLEEQRLLLAQRTSGPASLPDHLMVISVNQSDDEWEVSATVHWRNDDWTPGPRLGPIKVDLNRVRVLVARVFRDWASREAAVRGRVEPGEQIRWLGEILSHALLAGEIGDRFNELIDDPDHGWVEVALHFDEVDDPEFTEFVQLPWEYLYLPRRASRGDVYFAREPKLAFVRTLHPEPDTPKPSLGKLSLLVVAVMPEHAEDPDDDTTTQRDVSKIAADLKHLGELSESLDVTIVTSPGLSGLEEKMRSGAYDAVHYIGFGRFEAGDDRLALAITTPGLGEFHRASDFADCLDGNRNHMPRLVVLQIYRGKENVPADLAAFGPALLKKGCEGVVAYQYPVRSMLTQRFNAALYAALADGAPLEMAAQAARRKIWTSDSEGRAFLSPAVFVRQPGGLRLTPPRSETGQRSRTGALSNHG